MRLEETARIVARIIHRGHSYGHFPYTYHLAATVEVIKRYSNNPFVIAAGWLHDADEDTHYKVADIERDFGAIVAGLVNSVSSTEGNRDERTQRMYMKLAAGHPEAYIIKAADRIANMTASMSNNPTLYAMYQKELNTFIWNMANKIPSGMLAELELFLPPAQSIAATG